MKELESLGGIKEQLDNEKAHAEELQEIFHGVSEERDQLRRELDEVMEKVKSATCLKEAILAFIKSVQQRRIKNCVSDEEHRGKGSRTRRGEEPA